MNLGNKQTFYNSGPNSEHALINSLHGAIASGNAPTNPNWLVKEYNNLPVKDVRENYRCILDSYNEEALNKGWKCFGIKSTTGHAPNIFFELLQLQEEVWGKDIHYFTTVRHPLSAVERLAKKNLAESKNPENIYQNWMSHVLNRFVLIQRGATVVRFPEHFQNGKIKSAVESIGLEWTQAAKDMYKESQVTVLDQGAASKLFDDRPNMAQAYKMLIGEADG